MRFRGGYDDIVRKSVKNSQKSVKSDEEFFVFKNAEIRYNLNEGKPKARAEFRFTDTGTLNEIKPKAQIEFSVIGYGIIIYICLEFVSREN